MPGPSLGFCHFGVHFTETLIVNLSLLFTTWLDVCADEDNFSQITFFRVVTNDSSFFYLLRYGKKTHLRLNFNAYVAIVYTIRGCHFECSTQSNDCVSVYAQ